MFIKSAQAQELGTIDPSTFGIKDSAGEVVSAVIQLALAGAGLVFFAMLLIGGFKYLTAGGDEKSASAARSTLTSAFIGLIIIVAAFLVAQLLFNLFGLQAIIDFS